MNERSQRPPEGLKGIPVQEMPDFRAAIIDYGKILKNKCLVPQEDVLRIQAEIEKENKTRGDGNRFINHVASLGRGLNLP